MNMFPKLKFGEVLSDPVARTVKAYPLIVSTLAPDIVENDVREAGSRARQLLGKVIKPSVRGIAHNQALLAIEHRQPNRKVV